MGANLFTVLLNDGKDTKKKIVIPNSLRKIMDDFIDSNGYCICITRLPEEAKKQRYYKLKYDFLIRKYKANRITEE